MTRYFLGIDTGATKSHALIADDCGRAVSLGVGGPGNWESIGWEGTRATLDAIISQAAANAGIERHQIEAFGFGLAGYDWPEDLPPHVEIIHSLGIEAPYQIVNDAFIGLLAGASQGWGVAVAAGTSCNCYGRNRQGDVGRVGGASGWFGEYAGSSELVARAIHGVAKEWSMRGPRTKLTPTFVAAAGAADVVDLLGGLMRSRYYLGADCAPLVFEVAAQGDEVALELVRWAAQELAALAIGVIKQLALEASDLEVVLSGSFYNGSPMIKELMAETIHNLAPRAQLVRLNAPPVVGGVILAMEQVGLDTISLRPFLAETTMKLMAQKGFTS